MPPDLVIFDCDGVLVDSEPVTSALLREEFAARGLMLSIAEIDANFVGGTMARVAETARGMGLDLPPDWVRVTYDRMYERLAQGTPLVAGIEAVLDRLDAAGIRAGMRTLGFAAHDDGARLAAVGAEVFHHMDALPALLGLDG